MWNNCSLCKAKMERLRLKDEHFLQNHYLDEVTRHIQTKAETTIACAEHLDGEISVSL